jgi:uncharacterized membrane protein YkvA (DUF1232 family)
LVTSWKHKARELKIQTYALYYVYRDPRVSWYARAWIALLIAYAFSPIDLIPDFIPILGYLDDFVLLPLGVYLALKMIPAPVMEESRAKSEAFLSKNGGNPQYKFMSVIIIAIWIVLILFLASVLARVMQLEDLISHLPM